MTITSTNTGYVVQDANDAFYAGYGKFSNKLEDAKIYKRKNNALENIKWQVEDAKRDPVNRKTFAEPFKILKVTVNWTAVDADKSEDKPKPKIKDEKMTKAKALEIARDLVANIDHITDADNPRGSGYISLCQHTYTHDMLDDGEITLQIAAELCLYKDEATGRKYYGLYYVPEVDGGENFSDSEWSYTNTKSVKQVADLILELYNTFTRKYLFELWLQNLWCKTWDRIEESSDEADD